MRKNWFLILVIFLSQRLFGAGLGTGGYYELEYNWRQNYSDTFDWNLSRPKHYFQTKFWGNPFYGVDFYSQIAARTNENENNKNRLELERFWAKYWFKWGELYYLLKEERHWIDSPLLRLVDPGRASDNYQGQASRLNLFWSGGELNLLYRQARPHYHTVWSDGEWYGSFYDTFGDGLIFNFKQYIYDNQKSNIQLSTNLGWLSSQQQVSKFSEQYSPLVLAQRQRLNEVYRTDCRLNTLQFNWISEYALSRTDSADLFPAWASELRDFHLGPFWFLVRYYDYHRNFRSDLSRNFGWQIGDWGEKQFGRRGYNSQISYLLPKKMITLTYQHNYYASEIKSVNADTNWRGDYLVEISSQPQVYNYDYGEVYLEFLKGLKGKIAAENNQTPDGNFPAALLEVSAENFSTFGRGQLRYKDINSRQGLGERIIVGAELRYNLTSRLQFYWRTVMVNSRLLERVWSASFYQLRFNIGWDVESYLEYGDGWLTDNLVYDSDITDNIISSTAAIKFLLKVNFY